METFFLDMNQLMVGSMVLNATLMASFLGVSLSQRTALSRLEVALNEKNALLAGTSVAGLLTSSIPEIEDGTNLEVTELLDTEPDHANADIEINKPVLGKSFHSDDFVSDSVLNESQIMTFY
tara:strand:+ start:250 stop:615 length:366 start_codon:yes stop_codon:yes gene_type:complete